MIEDLELALRLVDAADVISLAQAAGAGSSTRSTGDGTSTGEARLDTGTALSSNGVLHDALLRSRAR